MRHLLVLAAAAFLAVGCAGRTEEETGAAPDQGDATVTATDTTTVQADTTMGAVPEPTVTDSAVTTDTTTVSGETTVVGDSVGAQGEVQATDTTSWTADTTAAAPADTTTSTPADTTAQQ